MLKARGQAEQYARALPTDEGWPPFLIVVDVGHTIELFADFTVLEETLRWFNGGLFEDCEALPLNVAQLDLLLEASQSNWRLTLGGPASEKLGAEGTRN